MAPSKAVTVLFFQSLPFHSSDSDELWSPAVLTKDKPHTPNHKQFGSLKQMVKEIPCINHKILQQLTGKKKKRKNFPFSQQNTFLNSSEKLYFSQVETSMTLVIFQSIPWYYRSALAWRISLARKTAEFEF